MRLELDVHTTALPVLVCETIVCIQKEGTCPKRAPRLSMAGFFWGQSVDHAFLPDAIHYSPKYAVEDPDNSRPAGMYI
ncbi:hypothetical protein BCR39DRAFT_512602 [Naematelia encephala]|uniref:Uncharacterized protein n=1 Tax=Naematelia encephala TaxID=71784 RepID=A0A1Y2BM59_9TREE|nr:hypothetical protein BCR39DRAFT_512602 [Naematelia encephala]